jgi:thiol-disulfide isomerase/thioredoxin
MSSWRPWVVAVSWVALASCTRPPHNPPVLRAAPEAAPVAHRANGAPAAPADGDGPPADPERFTALLVNGGGSPDQNYQSHLLHVQELTRLLVEGGLPRSRITILSSDGADPGRDLAVRAVQPEKDFWQLEGTPFEDELRTPIELANSQVPSMSLLPATEDALGRWFAGTGSKLRAGDTLLLYVTDHGTPDPRNGGNNNRISLWGRGAHLTVDELGALLGKLHPGVRVVTLMSQCFSGGFARLHQSRPPGGGNGGFSGYFSSTADRPAYGCYPENMGKNNVGHSFHFFDELARGRSLPSAHREVLTTDRTPDVPLRTSDIFLEEALARAAQAARQPLAALVDQLLAEAWKDRKAWEPEIRLLDRVGTTFGMWSPRSLAELEEQAGSLPTFARTISDLRDAWSDGLHDVNVARIGGLGEAEPQWQVRLHPDRLKTLPERERRALTADLLAALGRFDLGRERLAALRERSGLTADLDYRMEVRTGALLRLRTLLHGVAGRVLLARPGHEKERQAHLDLVACESLRLPGPPAGAPEPAPARDPFPAFKEDVKLAQGVVPTYIGIVFQGVSGIQQKRFGLPRGSALVQNVYPDSPAQKAGLAPGDVIVGLPGKPFDMRNEVRIWTYFATAGAPHALEVFRDGARQQVTIVPRPRPGQLPTLPEPPRATQAAPPLSVAPFRGAVPGKLDSGSPHLLLFWATWCGPCKASLPEVMAFSRARGVPVVAITDESAEEVRSFLSGWKRPFPENVALDELRRTFIRYGVSGVPTFVMVDGQGKVESHVSGYGPQGIGVPGWRFKP